jgi:hypothetical protein
VVVSPDDKDPKSIDMVKLYRAKNILENFVSEQRLPLPKPRKYNNRDIASGRATAEEQGKIVEGVLIPVVSSDGRFKTARAMITWLFEEHKMAKPLGYEEEVAAMAKGFSKDIANNKQAGVLDYSTGDDQLPFAHYVVLCMASLILSFNPMQHLFIVLCWVLINRSESTSSLRWEWFSYGGDNIFIGSPKSKGDAAGNNAYRRAIYANPFHPQLCAFVALFLAIICRNERHSHDDGEKFANVFSGQCPSKSFSEFLHSILKANFAPPPQNVLQQEWVNTTFSAEKGWYERYLIGTHSLRKGVVSFLLTCLHGGPSVIAIYLRAGWSIGNPQHTYVFQSEDADMYLYATPVGFFGTRECILSTHTVYS